MKRKRAVKRSNALSETSPPSKMALKPNQKIFPSDVLKFMKFNALKPHMSLKLMKVCKYFQHRKFPYFVVKSLCQNYQINNNQDPHKWTYKTLDNLRDKLNEIPNNLWITETAELSLREFDFSTFINKIAVCDAKLLGFSYQLIPLNLFKVISYNVRELYLTDCKFTGDGGCAVTMEDLFECLPNLEILHLFSFSFYPSFASTERANQVLPSKLTSISIALIGEDFNFDAFATFVLEHQNIYFSVISIEPWDQEYLQQVQAHIDHIFKEWNIKYLPPKFDLPGLTQKSRNALRYRLHKHQVAMKKQKKILL